MACFAGCWGFSLHSSLLPGLSEPGIYCFGAGLQLKLPPREEMLTGKWIFQVGLLGFFVCWGWLVGVFFFWLLVFGGCFCSGGFQIVIGPWKLWSTIVMVYLSWYRRKCFLRSRNFPGSESILQRGIFSLLFMRKPFASSTARCSMNSRKQTFNELHKFSSALSFWA